MDTLPLINSCYYCKTFSLWHARIVQAKVAWVLCVCLPVSNCMDSSLLLYVTPDSYIHIILKMIVIKIVGLSYLCCILNP